MRNRDGMIDPTKPGVQAMIDEYKRLSEEHSRLSSEHTAASQLEYALRGQVHDTESARDHLIQAIAALNATYFVGYGSVPKYLFIQELERLAS